MCNEAEEGKYIFARFYLEASPNVIMGVRGVAVG